MWNLKPHAGAAYMAAWFDQRDMAGRLPYVAETASGRLELAACTALGEELRRFFGSPANIAVIQRGIRRLGCTASGEYTERLAQEFQPHFLEMFVFLNDSEIAALRKAPNIRWRD